MILAWLNFGTAGFQTLPSSDASFQTKMVLHVRYEGVFFERRFSAGIPQGSALDLLLFSVYVKDVSREPGVHIAIVADDTALYISDCNSDRTIIRLQRQLDTTGKWLLTRPRALRYYFVSAGKNREGVFELAERTCAGPRITSISLSN